MDFHSLPGKPKNVLVRGAVRPWHLVFLYSVCFAVAAVASFYITKNESDFIRREMRDVVHRAIDGAIIITLALVVPELRRSLPVLFARPAGVVEISDIALAGAAMLCWGYGVYRVVLCFPFVYADPHTYYTHHLFSVLAPFEPKFLLILIGSAITAPLGEELIFRGFLLNLWAARWGVVPGILLSSIAFGLFHGMNAPFAFPMGVISALVYLKYDSLWPSIGLHSLYNFLAFPWLLGGLFYQKDLATANQLSSWSAEVVLALLFVPIALTFWRRFKPAAA